MKKITQETDQWYDMFKSLFCCNLEKLTNDQLAARLSISFNQSIIGLLVFGGNNETNNTAYANAFAIAFAPDQNRAAWEAVSAATTYQLN